MLAQSKSGQANATARADFGLGLMDLMRET
jgi:hypothetical protein